MRKITLLVNHFERFKQLRRTLKSIHNSSYKNLFVVILDHNSPSFTDNIVDLEELYPEYLFLQKPKPTDNWYSSIVSYNWGINYILKYEKPDIIMIQDAECYHEGDVITKASEITDGEYLSFAAFSTDEQTFLRDDFENVIKDIALNSKEGVWGNGVNAWYNHPIYRGVGYGFCCAITTDNMCKLNGFDERYMDGVAYGDDDWIRRIKKLGLKIEIPTDPFVVHQWHYDKNYSINGTLLEKNRDIYNEISNTEPGYKAKHLITKDF
jgi:hypothetical protein